MEIKEVKFIKSIIEFEKELNPMGNKKDKPKIFFLWRSNVGKSSLINSLLGKKELAYSWAKAWKTRTINIFEVYISKIDWWANLKENWFNSKKSDTKTYSNASKKYECMDFPGYWYAVWDKENKLKLRDMILDYLEQNLHTNLKAVLIIDAFVGPTPLDDEIYWYLSEKWVNILLILNKADKTNQKELQETIKKVEFLFPETKYILYSCKTGKYRNDALIELFD